MFWQMVFRQTIGIPMGTNCAPLLADLYLYYYEYKFMNKLITSKHLNLARLFNQTYRYIDDLISINNASFEKHVKDIYPPCLELKNTTESLTGTSYLDLYICKGPSGELTTKLYDKRDVFNFDIVNYPFMDSNIPITPAYGIYVSRLVAFARACTNFEDFYNRHLHLAQKLCTQGFNKKILRKTFTKFCDKHGKLLYKYHKDMQGHIHDILALC